MNTTSSELNFSYRPDFDLARATRQLRETAGLWRARSIQRRQLRQLSATQLADIGVSRAAAITEAGKPFWQR